MTGNSRFSTEPSEAQICCQFMDWVAKAGNTFLKPVFVVHIANEGSYSRDYRPAFGAQLKRMGKRSGMLDYLVLTPDDRFMLEFKSRTGRVSPSQTEVMHDLNRVKCDWYVPRSLEDAIEVFILRGVCRRTAGL